MIYRPIFYFQQKMSYVKKMKCEVPSGPFGEVHENLVDLHIRTSKVVIIRTNKYPLYRASSVLRDHFINNKSNEITMDYSPETIDMVLKYHNMQYSNLNPFLNITKTIFIEVIRFCHQYAINFDYKLITDDKLREFSFSGEITVTLLNFKRKDILDEMLRFKKEAKIEFTDVQYLKTPAELFALAGDVRMNVVSLINKSTNNRDLMSNSAIFCLERMNLKDFQNNDLKIEYVLSLSRVIRGEVAHIVSKYIVAARKGVETEKVSVTLGLKFD